MSLLLLFSLFRLFSSLFSFFSLYPHFFLLFLLRLFSSHYWLLLQIYIHFSPKTWHGMLVILVSCHVGISRSTGSEVRGQSWMFASHRRAYRQPGAGAEGPLSHPCRALPADPAGAWLLLQPPLPWCPDCDQGAHRPCTLWGMVSSGLVFLDASVFQHRCFPSPYRWIFQFL